MKQFVSPFFWQKKSDSIDDRPSAPLKPTPRATLRQRKPTKKQKQSVSNSGGDLVSLSENQPFLKKNCFLNFQILKISELFHFQVLTMQRLKRMLHNISFTELFCFLFYIFSWLFSFSWCIKGVVLINDEIRLLAVWCWCLQDEKPKCLFHN